MTEQPVAYLNQAFLESAEARPLRILAEYLEPLRRFKEQKIQDTIVFFGSARVDSRERATRALRTLRARGVQDADEHYQTELNKSRRALEWALSQDDREAWVVACELAQAGPRESRVLVRRILDERDPGGVQGREQPDLGDVEQRPDPPLRNAVWLLPHAKDDCLGEGKEWMAREGLPSVGGESLREALDAKCKHCGWSAGLGIQLPGGDVHAPVGGLRRKDHGDEQLEGTAEFKLAARSLCTATLQRVSSVIRVSD